MKIRSSDKYLEQGYLFREVAFGINTPRPVPLPLLEASLEVSLRAALQHCLRLILKFSDILDSFYFCL